jgi:phytoene dehydrogenase-like protein
VNPGRVVIVGSGIGGLSCGILLARLGYAVTLVERNRTPGGLMRSYTRHGIACPVGVHYLGAADRDQILGQLLGVLGVRDQLPLSRMGDGGVVDRYVFDDFTFDLPAGIAAFGQRLRQAFPDQGKVVDVLIEKLEATSARMNLQELILSPPGQTLLEDVTPMGRFLDDLGCSPPLRQLLEVPGMWLGLTLEGCPEPLYLTTLASYLLSSWRLRCSGAEMADLFVERLEQLGGRILLGAPVEMIAVQGKEVRGVTLASGESLEAEIVICAVHPKLVLQLLPEGSVRPAYRTRLSSLEETSGCIGVQVALPAAEFPALAHNLVRVRQTGGETRVVFAQVRPTARADTNLLTVLAPSRFERWRPWEQTLTGQRGEDYEREKEGEARRLLAEIGPLLGGLNGHLLLDVYTPLTIRDWVGSAEGAAYGVLRSSRQLLRTLLLTRTPIHGLHLAGQSTLAPGVLGTTLGSLLLVRQLAGPEALRSLLGQGFAQQ